MKAMLRLVKMICRALFFWGWMSLPPGLDLLRVQRMKKSQNPITGRVTRINRVGMMKVEISCEVAK